MLMEKNVLKIPQHIFDIQRDPKTNRQISPRNNIVLYTGKKPVYGNIKLPKNPVNVLYVH